MPMPEFPKTESALTREDVINQIIASIAMEELGLSHIINSEGEKLQYALGTIPGKEGLTEPPSVEDLLALNKSITKTLDSTMMNQFLMREKLQTVLSAPTMCGPTGPTGATGPSEPFLSSYMEALADEQTVTLGNSVVFDVDTADSVGNNIELDSNGRVFTITRTGLYHIVWSINIASMQTSGAVAGILENGEASSGAAATHPGNFSSGTLIQVDTVPFTISLFNFDGEFSLERPNGWLNSAGSIRIVRFADGPSS